MIKMNKKQPFLLAALLTAAALSGCGMGAPSDSRDVDLDLTTMSATMVYAEGFNIMFSPEEYIGKTILMDGIYDYYYSEFSQSNCCSCIIQDATACCSQGLEFVLTDDYTFPDDYPEVGDDITVCGVFDSVTEGEYTYYVIRDATLE